MIEKENTRFARKLENIFWWILRLLPLIIFFFLCIGAFTSKEWWQFTLEDGDPTSMSVFVYMPYIFSEMFDFIVPLFIRELVLNIFGYTGIEQGFYSCLGPGSLFVYYFAYLIFIELFRFFFNIIIFIIRFANRLIEKILK